MHLIELQYDKFPLRLQGIADVIDKMTNKNAVVTLYDKIKDDKSFDNYYLLLDDYPEAPVGHCGYHLRVFVTSLDG